MSCVLSYTNYIDRVPGTILTSQESEQKRPCILGVNKNNLKKNSPALAQKTNFPIAKKSLETKFLKF